MVLVFGGTTEGKMVTNLLNNMGCHFCYSTKTDIDFNAGSYGEYRYGAFDKKSLIKFIREKQISTIIHAAHPFALELMQTVAAAAKKTECNVLRIERDFSSKTAHPLVHYVTSYVAAIEKMEALGLNCPLALTGVQSIQRHPSLWTGKKIYFRILDRASSRAIASAANFPQEQLIYGFPSGNVNEEIALIQKLKIDGILTKESGDSGFQQVKIKAALAMDIPIVLIERPAVPKSFFLIYSLPQLQSELQKLFAL